MIDHTSQSQAANAAAPPLQRVLLRCVSDKCGYSHVQSVADAQVSIFNKGVGCMLPLPCNC